jgi:hypothetical protein
MTEKRCRQCGGKFTPAFRAGRNTGRSHRTSPPRSIADAQFCSAGCKQANYRWRRSSGVTPSDENSCPGTDVRSTVTRPFQVFDITSKFSKKKRPLGALAIVPDECWPGLYRIRRPDGSLTDMVNLTRAKDAAQLLTENSVREAA